MRATGNHPAATPAGEKPVNPARARGLVDPKQVAQGLFAALFGAFLGLSLLKFGNPPIMEKWVERPGNFFQFLMATPWPIQWAYGILALSAAAGLLVLRFKPLPSRLTLLPLLWFLWQIIAGHHSIHKYLSHVTLVHFIACLVCFYLGFFALSQVERMWPFWLGVLAGFVFVVAIGLDQHFGGLAEFRRYFYQQLYLYPRTAEVPPEFMKRMASNRIYSTLFYPNVLAGVLLLLLPPLLGAAMRLRDALQQTYARRLPSILTLVGLTLGCMYLYLLNSRLGWMLVIALGLMALLPVPKWLLPISLGLGASACLFWSGSKGGWLVMLFLLLITFLWMPLARAIKFKLVLGFLVLGLVGFFWKYSSFFQKGATSVSARFDYWQAAVHAAKTHPWTGTGPGTFYLAYEQVRKPGSEAARLVHNDYLEQASDSGLPGMLIYLVFFGGTLAFGFRSLFGPGTNEVAAASASVGKPALARSTDWDFFLVWLGLLGWGLQSFFEFGLYIPAIAWPGFAMMGWLLGKPRLGPNISNIKSTAVR